jgi:chromosome segregation ATPase
MDISNSRSNLLFSFVELKRVNEEINTIIRTHQDELKAVQSKIQVKQLTITEKESNLTAIGTYVDKLEERLTSFAVTRRDMEVREKKCTEIEVAAAKAEDEMKVLKGKVDDFVKEQSDLKKLLEEMVTERVNMQKENRKLMTEREFRIADEEQMQAKIASLESEIQRLTDALDEWKANLGRLTPELEEIKATNAELQDQLKRMDELESELVLLRSDNERLQADYAKSQEELELAIEEKKLDEARISTTPDEEIISTDIEVNKELTSENSGDTPPSSLALPSPRDVRFRKIRKVFSGATGMHGVLTPSSRMVLGGQSGQSLKNQSPPPNRGVPFRNNLRKIFSKTTGQGSPTVQRRTPPLVRQQSISTAPPPLRQHPNLPPPPPTSRS